MSDLEQLKQSLASLGIPFKAQECDFLDMPIYVSETFPTTKTQMKMIGTNTEFLFDVDGKLIASMTDVWGDEHKYSYVIPNGNPVYV